MYEFKAWMLVEGSSWPVEVLAVGLLGLLCCSERNNSHSLIEELHPRRRQTDRSV